MKFLKSLPSALNKSAIGASPPLVHSFDIFWTALSNFSSSFTRTTIRNTSIFITNVVISRTITGNTSCQNPTKYFLKKLFGSCLFSFLKILHKSHFHLSRIGRDSNPRGCYTLPCFQHGSLPLCNQSKIKQGSNRIRTCGAVTPTSLAKKRHSPLDHTSIKFQNGRIRTYERRLHHARCASLIVFAMSTNLRPSLRRYSFGLNYPN